MAGVYRQCEGKGSSLYILPGDQSSGSALSTAGRFSELRRMINLIRRIGIPLVRWSLRFGNIIAKFRNEKKHDFTPVVYSYFLGEAKRLGVEATLLVNNVMQLRRAGIVHNIFKSYTDLDGEGTLRTAGDKPVCAELLRKAGLPIPQYVLLKSGDLHRTLAFKERTGGDIVVKPARFTGDARGVSIKPKGLFGVLYAVCLAGVFGEEMIVEEFVEGLNYRLLYCKGRFLGAVLRKQGSITADGKNSIRELINRENRGRREQGDYLLYDGETRPILYRFKVDGAMKRWIQKQGWALDSVPEPGETVELQEICHWLKGGMYVDVTDRVSRELVEAGRKAVDVLGIKLAGVDLIAKDIDSPAPGSYVINEVNTTPGILVHYEVQNQDQLRPVAREILETMFAIGDIDVARLPEPRSSAGGSGTLNH